MTRIFINVHHCYWKVSSFIRKIKWNFPRLRIKKESRLTGKIRKGNFCLPDQEWRWLRRHEKETLLGFLNSSAFILADYTNRQPRTTPWRPSCRHAALNSFTLRRVRRCLRLFESARALADVIESRILQDSKQDKDLSMCICTSAATSNCFFSEKARRLAHCEATIRTDLFSACVARADIWLQTRSIGEPLIFSLLAPFLHGTVRYIPRAIRVDVHITRQFYCATSAKHDLYICISYVRFLSRDAWYVIFVSYTYSTELRFYRQSAVRSMRFECVHYIGRFFYSGYLSRISRECS